MKTRIFLLFMLCACVFSSYAQIVSNYPQSKKVAILEVVDKEGKINYGTKFKIRQQLNVAVTRVPGYEAYNRADIASIINEQEFQRTGMVTDAEIQKIGEMTGVEYILVAECVELTSEDLGISAQIIRVETARVIQAAYVESKVTLAEMGDACRKLAIDLLVGEKSGNNNGNSGGNGNMGYGRQSSGTNYTETVFGINMQMVYVEGGEFMMGCTSEQSGSCENDEKNVRRVDLDGFYIGKFEVTQGQWEKVMGTSVSQQKSKGGYGDLTGVGADYPMYFVSWEEATAFCEELSRRTGKKYRLPTEAEWEYAARGGQKKEGSKYSGSSSVDMVAWYVGNSGNTVHQVGTKRDNLLGIHDMSGNVWEWCKDWYGSDYSYSDTHNPQGPTSGSNRG